MRWARIVLLAVASIALGTLAPGAPSTAGAELLAVAASAPSAVLAQPPFCATLHPGNAATAVLKVDATGEAKLTLTFDALAFALDEQPSMLAEGPRLVLLEGPDAAMTELFAQARERFSTLFELFAEERRIAIEIVEFPSTTDVRTWQREHPEHRLKVKLDVVSRARLPAETRDVSLRFPEVIGDVIVTVDHPGAEPIALPMRAGERTPRIQIELSSPPSAASGSTADRAASGEHREMPMGTLEVFARYLRLGFTHIVPQGIDHVLFVLGLFLLSAKSRALLLQVTAFTVAHSITLALSMFEVVELPPSVVEPIIAASIAFVALENVATTRLHAWRPAVVFAFGLVHGMGFAGVLREMGLPRGQMATALVSFNVGVELGQLAVIAGAFAAVGWWRKREWYRQRIVVPTSLAIAAVGALWTVQRLS